MFNIISHHRNLNYIKVLSLPNESGFSQKSQVITDKGELAGRRSIIHCW